MVLCAPPIMPMIRIPALYAAAILRPWWWKAARMIRVATATEAGHSRNPARGASCEREAGAPLDTAHSKGLIAVCIRLNANDVAIP